MLFSFRRAGVGTLTKCANYEKLFFRSVSNRRPAAMTPAITIDYNFVVFVSVGNCFDAQNGARREKKNTTCAWCSGSQLCRCLQRAIIFFLSLRTRAIVVVGETTVEDKMQIMLNLHKNVICTHICLLEESRIVQCFFISSLGFRRCESAMVSSSTRKWRRRRGRFVLDWGNTVTACVCETCKNVCERDDEELCVGCMHTTMSRTICIIIIIFRLILFRSSSLPFQWFVFVCIHSGVRQTAAKSDREEKLYDFLCRE